MPSQSLIQKRSWSWLNGNEKSVGGSRWNAGYWRGGLNLPADGAGEKDRLNRRETSWLTCFFFREQHVVSRKIRNSWGIDGWVELFAV